MWQPPEDVYFPKIWVGVYGALLETLTLFQIKICDFPYSISDLTLTLFRLGKHFRRASNLSSLEKKINKKIASCKNHTRSHFRVRKPHSISDQNCQNLYPISDQRGSKTKPFGAAHTYITYIREYPPPREWQLNRGLTRRCSKRVGTFSSFFPKKERENASHVQKTRKHLLRRLGFVWLRKVYLL